MSSPLSLPLPPDDSDSDDPLLSPVATTDDERVTERSHRILPNQLTQTIERRRSRISSVSEYDIVADRMVPK